MNTFNPHLTVNPSGFGCQVNGDLTTYLKCMRLMLHDMAQPLSVISGTVDLLMIESDPRSRQFDEIKHISDQLQLIIDKMNDLKQLARQINSTVETQK